MRLEAVHCAPGGSALCVWRQCRPVARNFKGGAHGYGCELDYMEENVPF